MKPEELRRIESIVNEQIKAELDVFAKEAKLADAKRVNGLRAVFGEVRLENLYTGSILSEFSGCLHFVFHLSVIFFFLLCRCILTLFGLYQSVAKWRIYLQILKAKNGYQSPQSYVEVSKGL